MFAGLCVERRPIFAERFCKRAMYLKGSFAWQPSSCRARLQKKSPGFVITGVFWLPDAPTKTGKRALFMKAVLQKSLPR